MKALKTFILFFLVDLTSSFATLDYIIPPEIINDSFYHAIVKLAAQHDVKTILEIGSSSGEGSTKAFVTGIRKNPNHPTLYCLEVSKTRFLKLQKYFELFPFVKCYNKSSVSLENYPDFKEIENFMQAIRSPLDQWGLEVVKTWYDRDVAYIINNNKSENGIEFIKTKHQINFFDLVLIDGCEFTGAAELNFVYGAKYILLDDIRTFKNHKNFLILSKDPNYKLIEKNYKLRHGYAIFKKLH